ncbi:MAG: RNA-binding S4 domain-containing protein [Acetobacteraceae bacterium]
MRKARDERDWQRLDFWLWCARFARSRDGCAAIAAGGLVRINREPTEKAHARVRVGDVLTVPAWGGVRVVRIMALAHRRGPAAGAQLLYEELEDD